MVGPNSRADETTHWRHHVRPRVRATTCQDHPTSLVLRILVARRPTLSPDRLRRWRALYGLLGVRLRMRLRHGRRNLGYLPELSLRSVLHHRRRRNGVQYPLTRHRFTPRSAGGQVSLYSGCDVQSRREIRRSDRRDHAWPRTPKPPLPSRARAE